MDHIREVITAAESGDHDMIKIYISSGRIDCIDEEGSTPLMYAAANGHEKVTRLLLQNGVLVDQPNHYRWTALLQASCYGHHEVVYTLLQHGANINLGNSWGTTPLVAACQGGFLTVVQDLLDRGAGVNVEDEVTSITPLMAAAQCGSEAIVDKLLSRGSNVNSRLITTGWTALMLAALNNHVPVVRMLLSEGAVREIRDVNNFRAIDLATGLGHTDVVAVLSEDNLSTSSTDIDIFEAIKQGDLETFKDVLSKYKVSPAVTDKDGATPLMCAARKGYIEMCQLLLDSGADIDAQDYSNGWTAFMHAVHHRHHTVAQLLTDNNANVTLRAKNGSSAFDIANMIGDANMIQLIAQVTIQHLTQRDNSYKEATSPLTPVKEVDETKNSLLSPTSPQSELKSPTLNSSPPRELLTVSNNNEEVSAEVILRRLSNAYSASETPSVLDQQENKGFLRPRGRYAFPRSPSPDVHDPSDVILPAITKPHSLAPSLSPRRSTSPDKMTPPPPIIVPEVPSIKQLSKPIETQPDKPVSIPATKEAKFPKLRFVLPPTENDKSVGQFVPLSRDSPLIKSPRSLPTDPFNFLKSSPSIEPRSLSLKKDDSSLLTKSRSSPLKQKAFPGSSKSYPISRNKSDKTPPIWLSTPTKSIKKASLEKLKFKPAISKGPDLKTALENASLGHYYLIFKEEEMDIHSFLTLTEPDLVEVGVADSQDRRRLLVLISRLRDQSPRSPKSPAQLRPGGSSFQYTLQ